MPWIRCEGQVRWTYWGEEKARIPQESKESVVDSFFSQFFFCLQNLCSDSLKNTH